MTNDYKLFRELDLKRRSMRQYFIYAQLFYSLIS